jgi:hypothetical protein
MSLTSYAGLLRPYRMVHVGFNPRASVAELLTKAHTTIETYLTSLQGNWFRYGAQNYVVWTNKDLTELSKDIVALSGLNDFYVFVIEFDRGNYSGLMPIQFWDWINKYTSFNS